MEEIQHNLYSWRAFHFDGESLRPIWYSFIDDHHRASAIIDGEPWFKLGSPNRPYCFDLHNWNCCDITPAQDMDDEEWKKALPSSRISLMHATQAGFHSFNHAIDAAEYAKNNNAEILAKIQIAGRIIEHEYGYRSQYLRVTELYCEDGRDGSSIADKLGWPFELPAFSKAVTKGGDFTASFDPKLGEDAH